MREKLARLGDAGQRGDEIAGDSDCSGSVLFVVPAHVSRFTYRSDRAMISGIQHPAQCR